MSENNFYPKVFLCANPSCQKVVGVMERDVHHTVWLYVLKENRPKGTQIEDMELMRSDFSTLRVGFGDVPCTCGHNTRFYPSLYLLKRLVTMELERSGRNEL